MVLVFLLNLDEGLSSSPNAKKATDKSDIHDTMTPVLTFDDIILLFYLLSQALEFQLEACIDEMKHGANGSNEESNDIKAL